MTWDTNHVPDQTGRTVVVTGATAGIGYFAAEQLAAAGADVVLASRSADKLAVAEKAIRDRVPAASIRSVVLELGSFRSVDEAAAELSALPRLDAIFLNGGAMTMQRGAKTEDGHPVILGTHVLANFRLVAGLLPALADSSTRIVHASTGFVARFPVSVDDLKHNPLIGIAAYTTAKTATEVFAFELERRLRAAASPVISIVTRPGVGVDAKTPERVGIRDATTPYQRNPYTHWAQGKDAAAWSGVRALTDPAAQGGDYFAPAAGIKGAPILVDPTPRTASPVGDLAERVWGQLEELSGVELVMPGSRV